MLTKETPYLNIVGRGYRSFPILALERFLRTKGWEKDVPPLEIRETIKSAIGFLNLALMGYEIIDNASREKTFSGNLPAIRAYNVASAAYDLLAYHDISIYDLIVSSREALLIIISKSKEEINETDKRKINLMYTYIVELARVLYSDQ